MHSRYFLGAQVALFSIALSLSACSASSDVASNSVAQSNSTGLQLAGPASGGATPAMTRYKIVALNNLGGTVGGGISISDDGSISGFATLAGDQVVHAALWSRRAPTDLGTLGGANSAVEWPNHNEREVAGISQTSTVDPLGEHWSCSSFIPYTGNTCVGFVFRNHKMTPLPTLGGNNGFASGANAAGQVVGWAETSTPDGTCKPPQVLQFEAVVWGPNNEVQHVLPPFDRDLDTAATAINDQGQVVGISGICENAVGNQSARHAILWQNGVAISIGTLGGSAWNTPTAINESGAIAGFSDLPGDHHGDKPNFHAFLWKRANGIHDLGTLPGDTASLAFGINDEDQVVGQSCTTAACSSSQAFVWRNGVLANLNSLVPCGSPFLVFANDINDQGEIAGLGVDQAGNAVAFRAVPDRDAPPTGQSTTQSCSDNAHKPLSDNVRRLLAHFGGAR